MMPAPVLAQPYNIIEMAFQFEIGRRHSNADLHDNLPFVQIFITHIITYSSTRVKGRVQNFQDNAVGPVRPRAFWPQGKGP